VQRRLSRRLLLICAVSTTVVSLCAFAIVASRYGGSARYSSPPETGHETTRIRPPAGDGARIYRQSEPSLIETLIAAKVLVQAGVIPPPQPTPELIDILRAADQLVQAGAIARPAPLVEVLHAATQLADAGLIEPPPPPAPALAEALLAADALARAAAIAPTEQDAPEPRRERRAPRPEPTPVPTQAPPPPPPPADAPPAQPVTGATLDAAFAQGVFDAVNAQRAAHGLAPLAYEPRLTRAASDYALVLAVNDWFSHTGPDGSTIVSRIEAAGFPFTVPVGEVIAWGTDGWQPAEIAQAWMDSPSHREQILSDGYIQAGMGCSFANGAVRCVMDLAG
jgi:uncharacterized protein YkwD